MCSESANLSENVENDNFDKPPISLELTENVKNTNFLFKTSPNLLEINNPFFVAGITAAFWPISLVYWLKPKIWPIFTIPALITLFVFSLIYWNEGLYATIAYISFIFGLVASLTSMFGQTVQKIGPIIQNISDLRHYQLQESNPYDQD